MYEVEVIKANRVISDRTSGKLTDLLRVAPYARVSTDTEEQLSSYNSQVSYYTELVNKKEGWVLVEIYSDEAITGTQVTKREGFQKMIRDCMEGKIDMIITKSISRFARNTLDTLQYVRMLKEKNIAVYFEDEKINTLTMDGELLLVVLSSVAQQEVENISANVKKGLKMKMKRGELVGFNQCLGFDYDPVMKKISVNRKEAEVVKYIFKRYCEGMGCSVISKELSKLGYQTKYGNSKWYDTTVLSIIRNEKYKGDLLQGKTFTVDPISKRRLANFGEEDQFYIKNHHEAIISEELFDKAQSILNKRGKDQRGVEVGNRKKYSRKYTFSSRLQCGFCGRNMSRRTWHAGTTHEKVIWQCVTYSKKGKTECLHCKALEERIIEEAFVESYRRICYNHSDVLDEFLVRIEDILKKDESMKQIQKLEKEIRITEEKRDKLIAMNLNETIRSDTYQKIYNELEDQIFKLNKDKKALQKSAGSQVQKSV